MGCGVEQGSVIFGATLKTWYLLVRAHLLVRFSALATLRLRLLGGSGVISAVLLCLDCYQKNG